MILSAKKLHVAKVELTKRKVRLKQAFRLFLFKRASQSRLKPLEHTLTI